MEGPSAAAVRGDEEQTANSFFEWGNEWLKGFPLHTATKNNDVKKVTELLKDIVPEQLNLKDWDGRTALHHAAIHGYADIVSALIEAGAGVNIPDVNNGTPLFYACGGGKGNAAISLLTAGADPRIANLMKETPLHALCLRSMHSADVAFRLMSAGADVNARELHGRTPLHCLARSRRVEAAEAYTLKRLIEGGADIRAVDDEGKTALDHADDSTVRRILQAEFKSQKRPALGEDYTFSAILFKSGVKSKAIPEREVMTRPGWSKDVGIRFGRHLCKVCADGILTTTNSGVYDPIDGKYHPGTVFSHRCQRCGSREEGTSWCPERL